MDEAAMTLDDFRARWTGHTPKLQDINREYAVLVPLAQRPEGLCLLYEVRADTLGRQPGEVCFPGGRMEAGEDPAACALRETWEELSIPQPAVEVVAQLDFLTHQGGFAMYPVLGVVAPDAPVVPGPAEVAEVFCVPVDWLRRNPRRCTPTIWSPMWERTFPMSASASPRATAGGAGRWRCRCTTGRATPSGASPAASPGT